MPEIRYSIIIPHHNIPDLLQRCLDSIPYRDDIQIIVVDDNSDPSIVDFSNYPGNNRNNVELYFTKEGRGAGYARNVGLIHSRGEWILFADADDYYDTHNLNELLNCNLEHYEVVGWSCMKDKNGEVQLYDRNLKIELYSEHLFIMLEPWWKMVRRSFLMANDIKFQETIVSNDVMYSMKVANACDNYYFYNSPIYYWVIRENSLSSEYKNKKLKTALDVSINVNKFLKKIGKVSYYDRTEYYLSLMWQESHFLYWFYLLKILFNIGVKETQDFNKKASKMCYFEESIFLQIKNQLIVKLGSIKKYI